MDRGMIILLCVVFIILWTVGKRFRGRNRSPATPAGGGVIGQVQEWYRAAQEKAAGMDSEVRGAAEERWEALSESERLEMADRFFVDRFGDVASRVYHSDEKLRVSRMWYISENIDGD